MRVQGSRGESLRPVPRVGIVLCFVVLVDLGDLGRQRVVRVGIGEEGADGEEDLRDGEGGRPLILKDVEAD